MTSWTDGAHDRRFEIALSILDVVNPPISSSLAVILTTTVVVSSSSSWPNHAKKIILRIWSSSCHILKKWKEKVRYNYLFNPERFIFHQYLQCHLNCQSTCRCLDTNLMLSRKNKMLLCWYLFSYILLPAPWPSPVSLWRCYQGRRIQWEWLAQQCRPAPVSVSPESASATVTRWCLHYVCVLSIAISLVDTSSDTMQQRRAVHWSQANHYDLCQNLGRCPQLFAPGPGTLPKLLLRCEDAPPTAHPASHSHAQIHVSICHHASIVRLIATLKLIARVLYLCAYVSEREKEQTCSSPPQEQVARAWLESSEIFSPGIAIRTTSAIFSAGIAIRTTQSSSTSSISLASTPDCAKSWRKAFSSTELSPVHFATSLSASGWSRPNNTCKVL